MLTLTLNEEDYETIVDSILTVIIPEDSSDDEFTIELDEDEAWLLKSEGMVETVCQDSGRELCLLSPDYEAED